ncbi:MAG: hypothetical protein R3F62_04690 [Planctomycetota bacterium]
MSDCPRSELLVDLLEGFLEGDELRAAEDHLAECEACSEARDAYRQLWGDLEALPTPTPRPEARQAAYAAVLAAMAADAPAEVPDPAEAPAEGAPRRAGGRVVPWPLLAAAACLLLALPLSQFAFDGRPADSSARLDRADVPAAPPADPAPSAKQLDQEPEEEPAPLQRDPRRRAAAESPPAPPPDAAAEAEPPLDERTQNFSGEADAEDDLGAGGAGLSAGEAPEEEVADADGAETKEALRQRELRSAPEGQSSGAPSLAKTEPTAWQVTRAGDPARYTYAWSEAGRLEKVPARATPNRGSQGRRGDAGAPAPKADAADALRDEGSARREVARVAEPAKLELTPAQPGAGRVALEADGLSPAEAEDLAAILRFELGQPQDSAWGDRVRGLLSLLVGYEVREQDPAALEREAQRALSPELFMDEQLERKAAPDAPVQAR